jgi:hypothetical protein
MLAFLICSSRSLEEGDFELSRRQRRFNPEIASRADAERTACVILLHTRSRSSVVEQPFRNAELTSRARFFSTLSETYQSLKRRKTGVSGSVLGKEMGKDFRRLDSPLYPFPPGASVTGWVAPRGEPRAAPPQERISKTLR